MRVFPTAVQRGYLDRLSSFALSPAAASLVVTTTAPSIIPSPAAASPADASHVGRFRLLRERLLPFATWLIETGKAVLRRALVSFTVILALLASSSAIPAEELLPVTDEPPVIEQLARPSPSASPSPSMLPPAAERPSAETSLMDLSSAILIALLGVPLVSAPLVWLAIELRLRRCRTLSREGDERHPGADAAEANRVGVDRPHVEMPPPVAGGWRLGVATHCGLVRRSNEDAGCAFEIGTHQVLLVADGVGGMKHGGEAARAAVRAAERAIRQAWRVTPADREPLPAIMLSNAFAAAAARLAAEGVARSFRSVADGLRTTLIAVIGTSDRYHLGYIGDGGVSVVRADGTVDSLFVPHKADPARPNLLDASLGPTPHGAAVFAQAERRPADLLIAATDGICDRVTATFYASSVPRLAQRKRGDLAEAAGSALAHLAQHRDDDGLYVFDDNMTLALMGDGTAACKLEASAPTLAEDA